MKKQVTSACALRAEYVHTSTSSERYPAFSSDKQR
jgi:hypothetical protein